MTCSCCLLLCLQQLRRLSYMNHRFLFLLLVSLVVLFPGWKLKEASIYKITEGNIHFKSAAPLEVIEANSKELKGLIDLDNNTFAFTVPTTSFEGFNSSLQREHFNENYMESSRFPTSTFSGKMIEKIDVSKDGNYSVRAKGKLKIHGVEQERIIRSDIQIKDDLIFIKSSFTVILHEHNITIPKIVYQKIAEEIKVEISAIAKKK